MAFSQADLDAIAANAGASGLSSTQFLGQAQRETGGQTNPDTAASGTGPVGLFQVAPSTYIKPGYGLAGHPDLTYDEAQQALLDPNTNAQFAAQYDQALITSKGSQAAAITAYSGGQYTLDQVNSAASTASSLYPNYAGLDSNPSVDLGAASVLSGGQVAGDGAIGLGTTAATAATGAVQSWGAYLGEIGKRLGVVSLGLGLILLALFWLFASAAIHEWKQAPVVPV